MAGAHMQIELGHLGSNGALAPEDIEKLLAAEMTAGLGV